MAGNRRRSGTIRSIDRVRASATLAFCVVASATSPANAERPLRLREIYATVMLPTGWSFVARAPVEGRAGFESYSVADGADGRTRITIAVGPYGVPATPETLAKVVDTMLDVSLDRIRRLKSLGEAHEVERAATEIQGMAAGFAIVEIASPPLFDGPPDILRGATFIAVDGSHRATTWGARPWRSCR